MLKWLFGWGQTQPVHYAPNLYWLMDRELTRMRSDLNSSNYTHQGKLAIHQRIVDLQEKLSEMAKSHDAELQKAIAESILLGANGNSNSNS